MYYNNIRCNLAVLLRQRSFPWNMNLLALAYILIISLYFLFALYCNLLNAIALNYALWQGRDILMQVFRVQN